MASIASTAVDRWSGTIQGPRVGVETFRRMGTDGTGYYETGTAGAVSTVETVKLYADESTANTGQAAFEALAGDVIAVTDAHGKAWANVLVLGVSCSRTAITGVAGATVALTLQWQFIAEAEPPAP